MFSKIRIACRINLMRSIILLFISFNLLAVFATKDAFAAEIFLKDGTIVYGDIWHAMDGHFDILLPTGERMSVHSSRLKKIVFEPGETSDKKEKTVEESVPAAEEPAKKKVVEKTTKIQPPKKPRRQFSTPKKTFKFWRKSLLAGDLEGMADSFVDSAASPMLEKLQEIPENERLRMIEDTSNTKFSYGRTKIAGVRATLPVTRKFNKQKVTVVHQFKKQNGEWRLLPQ